jgi:hypothetical protein
MVSATAATAAAGIGSTASAAAPYLDLDDRIIIETGRLIPSATRRKRLIVSSDASRSPSHNMKVAGCRAINDKRVASGGKLGADQRGSVRVYYVYSRRRARYR